MEMKFTSAKLVLSHLGSPPNAVVVSIRRSSGEGDYVPSASPIGTPASIPGTNLTGSPLWVEATFADVVITNPAREDYCLVIEVPTTPVTLRPMARGWA